MATDVIMPQMGESIAEGTVTKWLKKVGEHVARDEELLEISTDKVDTVIPSPAEGVITEIKVSEGETVPIHTVIAILDGPAAGSKAPTQEVPESHHIRALEERFCEALGTRVRLKHGKDRGRVIIYYYTDEEFQALYQRLTGDRL